MTELRKEQVGKLPMRPPKYGKVFKEEPLHGPQHVRHQPEEVSAYFVLANICRKYKIENYLEIGVNRGVSFECVCQWTDLKAAVLCDKWSQPPPAFSGHDHIDAIVAKYAIHRDRVYYLDGDSRVTVATLHNRRRDVLNQGFDLVLVDGDHHQGPMWYDMELSWPLVKPGGFVVCGDLNSRAPAPDGDLRGTMLRFIAMHDDAELVYLDQIFQQNPAGAYRKVPV